MLDIEQALKSLKLYGMACVYAEAAARLALTYKRQNGCSGIEV